MREKVYNLLQPKNQFRCSTIYKYFMIFLILLSVLPLTTKQEIPMFWYLELFCLIVFTTDYFLRWLVADYIFDSSRRKPFLWYPFRPISVIDLLSMIALLASLGRWFDGIKFAEIMTVFRIVRIFRYSKSLQTIIGILKRSQKALLAVGSLAIGYIFISAIVMFNVEPASFDSFFDAIYWSTVSLTTVGYGDICPVTTLGRTVAMMSSFIGIAIVALPAAIMTAEYLNTVQKNNEEKNAETESVLYERERHSASVDRKSSTWV